MSGNPQIRGTLSLADAAPPHWRRRAIEIHPAEHGVYALCNDGTIWRVGPNHCQRFMDIPPADEPKLPNLEGGGR